MVQPVIKLVEVSLLDLMINQEVTLVDSELLLVDLVQSLVNGLFGILVIDALQLHVLVEGFFEGAQLVDQHAFLLQAVQLAEEVALEGQHPLESLYDFVVLDVLNGKFRLVGGVAHVHGVLDIF